MRKVSRHILFFSSLIVAPALAAGAAFAQAGNTNAMEKSTVKNGGRNKCNVASGTLQQPIASQDDTRDAATTAVAGDNRPLPAYSKDQIASQGGNGGYALKKSKSGKKKLCNA